MSQAQKQKQNQAQPQTTAPVVLLEPWLRTLRIEQLSPNTSTVDAVRALSSSTADGVMSRQMETEYACSNLSSFHTVNGRLCYEVPLPRSCDLVCNIGVGNGNGNGGSTRGDQEREGQLGELKLVIGNDDGGEEFDPANVCLVLTSAPFSRIKARLYINEPLSSFTLVSDRIWLQHAPRQKLALSDVKTATHMYKYGIMSPLQ